VAKELLIFMHTVDDAPGYVATILRRRNIRYRVIHSYENETIPELDDTIAGLIFLGGTMSVNDDIDWIEQEVRLIRQAIAVGLPIIGHCLGGQLISKALGQQISKNPAVEIGWFPCFRENNSEANAWLGDIEEPFIMFHWHDETFALPPQAKLLFSSKYCENQAYSYGDNVLAMQCHIEMTEPLLNAWFDTYAEQLLTQSKSEQSHTQMKVNLTENVAVLNRVTEQLYAKWLSKITF